LSTPAAVRTALATLAVLALSAGGGFVLYRFALGHRDATLYAAPPSAVPLPREAASTDAPPAPRRIPEELPDLALPGLDGAKHFLSQWQGRPLIINFWATWCEPCRREIPLLKSLRQGRQAQHLEVIGIAVDTAEAVRQYAARNGIDYPVLVGEEGGLAAVDAFGMDTVLPFSVFVDRAGQVVSLKVGELHRDEAQFILDRIADVDAGRLALKPAREQIAAGTGRRPAAQAAQ
jgi:thiol-disulfide isomerase/thioredoxin